MASQTFRAGDRVRLVFDDNPNLPVENKLGRVDRTSLNMIMVTFDDGVRRMVRSDALELVVEGSESHSLMSTVDHVLEGLDDGAVDQLSRLVSSEPFHTEIQIAFAEKKTGVIRDLIKLKHTWASLQSKKVGRKLREFIERMTPHFDRFITMTNLVSDDRDLRQTKSAFFDLLQISGDATQSNIVQSWVDLQLKELKEILG